MVSMATKPDCNIDLLYIETDVGNFKIWTEFLNESGRKKKDLYFTVRTDYLRLIRVILISLSYKNESIWSQQMRAGGGLI